MGLNFSKTGVDDAQQAILVNAAGQPVKKLRAELTWTQPQAANRGGGWIGKKLQQARDAKNATDVDANVVIFVAKEDVEFAGPDNLRALKGLVEHKGNVARGNDDAPEIIDLDLASVAERESDITAFAFTASCFLGDFSKVTAARVEFYDETNGTHEPLNTIRFSITADEGRQPNQYGPNNAALVAVVVKTPDGWALRKDVKTYGQARDWKGLAPICRRHVV